MSILVVGSVAFDTITTPAGKVNRILGGSASYFSLGASFFGPVNLVAVVGEDFPEEYINLFKEKAVDIRGLEIVKGKTFHWEGEYGVDFGDPQTRATDLNVFADFNPQIPREYRGSEYVFLANIDPDLQDYVLSQVEKPKLIACDTMNHWITGKRQSLLKLLKKVDIFLLNGSEAKQLTGEANLIEAGRQILNLGPKVVVVKKGEHGVLLFSDEGIFTAPAYSLEAVCDPTGAGDTFAGGFLGYLAKADEFNPAVLRKAVVCGSVMATFAVEDFSLRRLASITWDDIQERIAAYEQMTRF